MSDDQHEPSAFEAGVVAGLRRELAEAKAAATALAERDAATIARLKSLLPDADEVNAEIERQMRRIAELTAERDAWQETAAQHLRNEMYHRDLLTTIGETIGGAAYICDDGSLSDSVLRAKLPQLVSELCEWRDLGRARIAAMEDTSPGPALVAETREAILAQQTALPYRTFQEGQAALEHQMQHGPGLAGAFDNMRAAMPARALRPGDGIPR